MASLPAWVLFDQNLSIRLSRLLADCFDTVAHVRSVGLEDADDATIWSFAKTNQYLILTRDADFNDLSVLRGFPPKIIWLRCGNRSTKEFETIIRANLSQCAAFIADDTAGLLEIFG